MKLVDRAITHAVRMVPMKFIQSRLTRSVVSFTFDDFPKSAWTVGGDILARYGALATYYTAGMFCGRTVDGIEYYDRNDLLGVYAAGHEIGDHTYSHNHGRKIESQHLITDIARNTSFIQEILGDVVPTSFAYPYGEASFRTKRLCAGQFACCRGTEFGINRGFIDLSQLRIVSLEIRMQHTEEVSKSIDIASRIPSWIIFLTHDVAENASIWGSRPEMLVAALSKVREAGLEILTVKDALARACLGFSSPQN
jgi:peptidoglycan/xylan/chitin deacetylase (PgdA/CDA1 family)